jgi:hypothetical protein
MQLLFEQVCPVQRLVRLLDEGEGGPLRVGEPVYTGFAPREPVSTGPADATQGAQQSCIDHGLRCIHSRCGGIAGVGPTIRQLKDVTHDQVPPVRR